MIRTHLSLFVLAAFALTGTARAGDDEKGFEKLFNGKNLDGFKTNVFKGKKDVEVKDPFSVKEGVIDVTGSPNGYFYTDKAYKNYVVRFDWKFLKDGNSGTLIHIQGHGGGWPKCVEVQGQQSDHARIFGLSAKFEGKTTTGDKEAKAAGTKEVRAAQMKAIKMGEWNTTEITCKGGEITTKINGILIDTGKGELTEGAIGWQSEGAPLQFKNIRIKMLD